MDMESMDMMMSLNMESMEEAEDKEEDKAASFAWQPRRSLTQQEHDQKENVVMNENNKKGKLFGADLAIKLQMKGMGERRKR